MKLHGPRIFLEIFTKILDNFNIFEGFKRLAYLLAYFASKSTSTAAVKVVLSLIFEVRNAPTVVFALRHITIAACEGHRAVFAAVAVLTMAEVVILLVFAKPFIARPKMTE